MGSRNGLDRENDQTGEYFVNEEGEVNYGHQRNNRQNKYPSL